MLTPEMSSYVMESQYLIWKSILFFALLEFFAELLFGLWSKSRPIVSSHDFFFRMGQGLFLWRRLSLECARLTVKWLVQS